MSLDSALHPTKQSEADRSTSAIFPVWCMGPHPVSTTPLPALQSVHLYNGLLRPDLPSPGLPRAAWAGGHGGVRGQRVHTSTLQSRNPGPRDVLSVSLALGQPPGAWKPSLASPNDSPCQHLMSHSCWQMGDTAPATPTLKTQPALDAAGGPGRRMACPARGRDSVSRVLEPRPTSRVAHAPTHLDTRGH